MCSMYEIMFADSIEANVEHATIHVEKGTEQLSRARDYQVSALYQITVLFGV